MKRLLLFLSALLLTARATAQEKAATGKTAEQIVQDVHMSRAFRNDELNGALTKGGKSVPFTVKFQDTLIHFSFSNPKQIIRLDITDKTYRLREVTANSNKEVPSSQYSVGIRGTDLTYDDISFRYLYWPKKQLIGDEIIRTRKCHVVDLYNPDNKARLGEYYMVRIFVDKESGGLVRMQAYDWNGKLIKSCTATGVMKIKGATVLKSMDVVRYVPGTKTVAGETTFELQRPKGN
jgi:hypothetical protein